MVFRLKEDLCGRRFGLLTVLAPVQVRKKNRNRPHWECRCDCGGSKVVSRSYLIQGWTKSCGCLGKKPKLDRTEAECRMLFRAYSFNAKHRKHEFFIPYDEFVSLVLSSCSYCGSEPTTTLNNYYRRVGLPQTRFNGVDRKDNNLGYVSGNCVSCCKLCNYMKRGLTVEDFKSHIEKIQAFWTVKN